MVDLYQIQLKISEAIKQSGVSQKILAKELNVSQSCVSRYLNCKYVPSLDVLVKLCVLLELDANEILCLNN